MTQLALDIIAENKAKHARGEDARVLDLGNCGLIEVPKEVGELVWLEELVLGDTWISEDYNEDSILDEMGIETEIHEYESGYKVVHKRKKILPESKIPFLPCLRKVILTRMAISDLSIVEDVKNLEIILFDYTSIIDLSPLKGLNKLKSIYCNNTGVNDLSPIAGLAELKNLNCRFTKVSDLTPLQKLKELKILNCSFTNINNINGLETLSNLERLYFNSTKVESLEPLSNLFKLKRLDFRSTSVNELRYLKNLNQLKQIDCSNTDISDLNPIFHLIEKGVPVSKTKTKGAIYVRGCKILIPPYEVVKQGNAAILEYFRQKEKAGIKPLLEAKMVLLGEGRAGKTSLACRMLGKELPKQEDRTQGVDIVIGEYRFPVEEGEFVLHIWDFAGQDKYKPLHQFFYTEGAVYVMVADSGNAQTDFADWFETTEMFGGEGSPLLVALNEFREGMGIGAFDEEKWRKQFPKLIKEVRLVNLLSQNGFPALEKDIRHLANQLPRTRTEYPANWANIRAELERRRDENYISLPEYLKICKGFDLPERESTLILSGILHRIGVCLHYQKSELLRQHVILKNEWATAAVYKILEDQTVAEVKKGFFDWSDLRRIWSDDSYQDMQPQLLELMCEFKMAYPLPNGKEFVTPPLLPRTSPQGWDLFAGKAIEVRVEFEFLPKALMTQFIVSRHTDIDRGRTLVWREGVVLRWSADTLAQVSKVKSRGRDALQILAIGSERRGLLTAILKTLRDLHEEYRGIRAHEIVPCPCEGCRTEKNPQHYFDFKNLSNRLEKGRRVVECDQSLEEVDLLKILGDLLLFERLDVGETVVLAKSEKPVQKSGISAEMISTIREKLKKDKLEEALDYLEAHAPTESILLQAQISRAAKNTQQGLDGLEQESTVRQRTIKAVLAWLEEL